MTSEQYRELLIKYIKHIGYVQGTSFIDGHEYEFTDAEFAMLKELDIESMKQSIKEI